MAAVPTLPIAPTVVAVVATLLVAACGPAATDGAAIGDRPEPTDGANATSPTVLSAACELPTTGHRVPYPDGWHVNTGEVLPPCHLFDPEPIEVDPGTEVPLGIAIALRTTDVPLETFATGDRGTELLFARDTTVAGHDAVVAEVRSTGAALLPGGARSYRYAVDLGDRRLVALTHDVGEPGFEHTRDVLDRMMAAIDRGGTPHAGPPSGRHVVDDVAVQDLEHDPYGPACTLGRLEA